MYLSFDYAPVRPPTEAYVDRLAAERWREQVIPATSWGSPGMRIINLEGIRGLEIGAISEMVLPVVQGIASGTYGRNFAFGVITSDEPVVQWITAVAGANRAPVFLSASTAEAPRAIRPAGTLTATEGSTLDTVIALGGATTAAQLAIVEHLEAAAANNRLVALERKGFLIRYARNRRDGDLFVDPGTRAQSVESTPQRLGYVADVELPVEVEASIRALAAQQGRNPSDVLAEAWRMYFERHIGDLNAAVAMARVGLDTPDASLPEGTDEAELDTWAEAAAARMRDE